MGEQDNIREKWRVFLARPRVTALFSGTFTEGITLVVAPPGFGKTTALRDFLTGDPNVAWIALSAGAGVETFVRDLLAVIEPNAVRTIGALFDGRTEATFEKRMREWVGERLRSFDGTIVIDDLHRVGRDRDVMATLAHLVTSSHERIRWIFASRETPHLPMGTWVARGWMSLPITETDLAFDATETGDLAKRLSVGISDDVADTIATDTRGWPIGVRVSIDLVARNTELRPVKIRTRKVLFDHIDTEMWAPLSEGQQSLLCACALQSEPAIDVLRAAGFGDAEAALDELVERIPFLRSNGDGTFVLHDLFRDFLLDKLRRHPQENALISQRLARAFTGRRRFADALRLSIATADVDGTRRLLSRSAFDLIETGHRELVTTALASLDGASDSDAVALGVRAALSFSDGSGTNAIALYRQAIQLGVPAPMKWDVTRRLARIYLNRAEPEKALEMLTPLVGQRRLTKDQSTELRAFCATAFAVAGRSAESEREVAFAVRRLDDIAPSSRAHVLHQLGIACFYNGDFPRSVGFARDATILAPSLGLDALAANAYSTLYSASLLVDEDSKRAYFYNQQLISFAERSGNMALRVHAIRAEFTLCATAGDVDGATRAQAALAELTDARIYRDVVPMRQCRALVSIAAGNLKRALTEMTGIPDDALTLPERAFRDGFLALVLLLNDRRDQAAALLDRPLLIEADTDTISRRYISLAFAFRSLALWSLERPAQARRALGFDASRLMPRDRQLVAAIAILVEQPYPIPNADAASDAYAVLDASNLGGYAVALRRLVTRSAAEVELTPAEIEILRSFHETGGRAADVAKILNKSRFTVQNHVQAAIRKIGCSGRSEALAYARKRGWFDGP